MNKVVYTVSKDNPLKIESNMLASTCHCRRFGFPSRCYYLEVHGFTKAIHKKYEKVFSSRTQTRNVPTKAAPKITTNKTNTSGARE